ncbi:MAG TPA: O-antigen ligase family protein [Armatimonadota bacterium]|jgi:O-antigen ligase
MTALWMALLGATLFFAPWLGGQFAGPMPGVARALAAAAALIWALDRRMDLRVPRPAAWLLAFAAWSALVAAFGLNAHGALSTLSDLITWAALCAMCADAAKDSRARTWLIGALMASLAIVGLLAVLHAQQSGPGWREFGPFTTPNLFACYLATVLPLAALVALSPTGARRLAAALPGLQPSESGGRPPRSIGVLASAAFLLGMTALFFTGSKGAVLACGAGLLAGILAGRAWRKTAILPAVGLAAMLLIAALAGGRTLLGRVESAGTTEAHSSQFRVITWKGAARMARAHPVFGVGPGSFGAAFNRYAIGGWTQAAHNAYLQTAAETGAPGLLLLVAALGSAAVGLLRRSGASLLAAAALAGLLAAAAHNLVDYGWTLWAPGAVLWALIGLAEPAEIRPPKWLSALWLASLAGALGWALLTANAAALTDPSAEPNPNQSPAEAADAIRQARRLDPLDDRLPIAEGHTLLQAGDGDGALAAFTDATRISPWDAVAWRRVGEMQLSRNDFAAARAAFAKGLSWSPNGYKLLLDAARTEEALGNHAEALALYRRLAAVYEGPVGQYPPTPEIVDIEPLYAYDALLKDARRRNDEKAEKRFRAALIALADRYETNRAKYPMIWQATHKDDPADLAEVQRMREQAKGGGTSGG